MSLYIEHFFKKNFESFSPSSKILTLENIQVYFDIDIFSLPVLLIFQKYSTIRRKDVIYVNIFLLLKNSTYTKTHQLYLFTMHKTMSTYFLERYFGFCILFKNKKIHTLKSAYRGLKIITLHFQSC